MRDAINGLLPLSPLLYLYVASAFYRSMCQTKKIPVLGKRQTKGRNGIRMFDFADRTPQIPACGCWSISASQVGFQEHFVKLRKTARGIRGSKTFIYEPLLTKKKRMSKVKVYVQILPHCCVTEKRKREKNLWIKQSLNI